MTGKTGGFSFGVLGALNEEEEGDPLYSVIRVQKDIFKNSQIGIYYTGLNADNDYNRNFAVDYTFNFKDVYYLRGMSGLSANYGVGNNNSAMHVIRFKRDIDAGIQMEMNFSRIEENVDIRTGFVNQIDVQTTELSSGYAWRFNQGKVKRVSLDLYGRLHQDTHGNTTGNAVNFSYWTEFLAQFRSMEIFQWDGANISCSMQTITWNGQKILSRPMGEIFSIFVGSEVVF